MRKTLWINALLAIFLGFVVSFVNHGASGSFVLPAYLFWLTLELGDPMGERTLKLGMELVGKKKDWIVKSFALVFFGATLLSIIASKGILIDYPRAGGFWIFCFVAAALGTLLIFSARISFTISEGYVFLLDDKILWREGQEVSLPFYSDLLSRVNRIVRTCYPSLGVECVCGGDVYSVAIAYEVKLDLNKVAEAGWWAYRQINFALVAYLETALANLADANEGWIYHWKSFHHFWAAAYNIKIPGSEDIGGKNFVTLKSGERVDVMDFVVNLAFRSLQAEKK